MRVTFHIDNQPTVTNMSWHTWLSINYTTEDFDRLLDRQDSTFYMLYSVSGTTIIMAALVLQSILITFLNLIVLIVIFSDSKMRSRPQFLYISNLAFCDFLLGCFVSPLNIPFILYREKPWSYGRNLCKAWQVFDNVVSSEIAMAIALIMYDRYSLARLGISYFNKKSFCNTILHIHVTWVWCFFLYCPAVIFWDIIQGYSNIPEHECKAEYSDVPSVNATLTILEMAVPTFFISYYSVKLYYIYQRKKQPLRETLTISSICGNEDAVQPRVTEVKGKTKVYNKTPKFGKNLFVALGVFLLFWVPYITVYIMISFLTETSELNFIAEAVYWYNIAGSIVHPFLFAFMCPRFTNRLGQIIMKCKRAALKFFYHFRKAKKVNPKEKDLKYSRSNRSRRRRTAFNFN